jgi:hypothetical protein
MVSGTTVDAPAERRILYDEFLRVVCADDQFVRAEFDALLDEVWGAGHESASGTGAANRAERPPRYDDPQITARTRSALLADPRILRHSRQRPP